MIWIILGVIFTSITFFLYFNTEEAYVVAEVSSYYRYEFRRIKVKIWMFIITILLYFMPVINILAFLCMTLSCTNSYRLNKEHGDYFICS